MSTAISAKDVASLRNKTGAGMMDCKKALAESGGDLDKAVEYLRAKGIASAEKRTGKSASEGLVGTYAHFNGKVAVMVEVNCETDFVARTDDFGTLVNDIALHIASMKPVAVTADGIPSELIEKEKAFIEKQVAESGNPANVMEKMVEGKLRKFLSERALLDQPFVKDDKQTVGEVVKTASGKLGENIVVRRFARFELGEE